MRRYARGGSGASLRLGRIFVSGMLCFWVVATLGQSRIQGPANKEQPFGECRLCYGPLRDSHDVPRFVVALCVWMILFSGVVYKSSGVDLTVLGEQWDTTFSACSQER